MNKKISGASETTPDIFSTKPTKGLHTAKIEIIIVITNIETLFYDILQGVQGKSVQQSHIILKTTLRFFMLQELINTFASVTLNINMI